VSGNNIFAGTYGDGVFLSTNNGVSWTNISKGLGQQSVYSLTVSGGNIFAGTNGRGVWRRPLSEILGVINPNLHQGISKLYASGFKINISKNDIAVLLPETLNNGAITVELVNFAGRKIYSATHQAYDGILSIPVSGLSTGTYLMSITGMNTTVSSSFVVTK
jgi:Secretion system C-terminal sorting domain